jgi:uncharacterized membrane protein
LRSSRLALLSTLLCLVGLAIAAYLTYEHYSASTTLSCPNTGTINCLKVTTSSYSTVFGVPVALAGLLYYIVMTGLCQPLAWRVTSPDLTVVRLVASAAGVAFVLYLVWAELFRIDAICLWCTGVHIVTLVLFVSLSIGYALEPRAAERA